MDIGIILGLLCLIVAIISLLIFIARCNRNQAKETRAAWQAAHPALPNDYEMRMALIWTGVICAGGAIGGQALTHFVASPDVFSGLGLALALWTLIGRRRSRTISC